MSPSEDDHMIALCYAFYMQFFYVVDFQLS